MSAQENKQTAKDAYAAFGSGDAEGAMRNSIRSDLYSRIGGFGLFRAVGICGSPRRDLYGI